MAIPGEPTLSTRISVLKRSEGRSACKFSAYISGTQIEQAAGKDREAATFDYRQRVGVEYAELLTPEGAPEWAKDRQSLWNRVEATEKRKDSQVGREFRFGFSYDLTAEQREAIARQVAASFTDRGMCADVAVHRYSTTYKASDPRMADQLDKWTKWGVPFVTPEQSAGLDSEHVMVRRSRDGTVRDYRLFQPHAHILLTMRPFDGDNFALKNDKTVKVAAEVDGVPVLVDGKPKMKKATTWISEARTWNDQTRYEGLRGWITELQNAALEGNGSPRRVDPRGYEVRREAALDLAERARSSGHEAEAARQEGRAAMLHRQPEPYLGVALRVKEFTGNVRARFSQWVAVRHANRLRPQVDELWKRDHVDFVTKAHHLLELARQGLGLLLPAKPAERDREVSLER